jgi:anion-transporting  ArsA/GET3 family ATPase
MSVLHRRLVIVTGKGGVGKTTVAASLAVLAARQGKRVVLCDVSGRPHDRAEGAGVTVRSIDPDSAKVEWLRRQLRSGALAGILARSRIFELLTAAAPGLAELVTIGKVWDLARPERSACDLVVLDGPPTGEGLALLTSPRSYANLARIGPVHHQAVQVDAFLRDRTLTAVVGVALPEELPVSETIELAAKLRDGGLALDAVVANGMHPERFNADEAGRMAKLDGRVSPGARAALDLAHFEYARSRRQRAELRRLRRDLDAPVITLPFLFEPVLGPAEFELLSRHLEQLP